jgi:lysophospholipase L1-like esterase
VKEDDVMHLKPATRAVVAAAALLAITGAVARGESQTAAQARWVTAWGTSQQTAGPSLTNTTVRLNARVTIGGDAVRLRFDNAYGRSAITIGRAYVGLRARGALVVPGSNQPILFAGRDRTTVPVGGSVVSDPVGLSVLAMQDLAVSLYLPDADVQASQHSGAMTTSFAAAPNRGDHAAVEGAEPFSTAITTMPLLKSIDVRSAPASGAIVAFGDSITDGTCSTLDAHDRWVDWLSVRLRLDTARRDGQKAVVNEGIGGNTLTGEGLQPPPDSTPGLERLERDVLSHQGVTDVILFMGTNDIRRGASAAQVVDAMTRIATAIKSRRMKVFGATIIPRHNVPPSATNTGWNDAKTAVRREVNQWIRTRAPFDGVLDFDAAVRDPANGDLIHAPFNCDGIHPTPRGYFEMGRLLPLDRLAR